mmetsp:Transcript_36148/g.89071  ORF Transcript_36148/g.89071 Transcript_36148/m.89071 type:complete len:337 (-) Transcript_36148:90-1100(-)
MSMAEEKKKKPESGKKEDVAAGVGAGKTKTMTKEEVPRNPKKRNPRKPKGERKKPELTPASAATALATAGVTKPAKKVRKPKTPKAKAVGGINSNKGAKYPKKGVGGNGNSNKSPANKSKNDGGGGGGKKDASKWKPGDWACAKCGAHNFRGKDACFRCKYAKANSIKAANAETAWDYLTKWSVDVGDEDGDWELDTVQHLYLCKAVYAVKEINDASFDLFMPYVESLDNKLKLKVLEGARLALVRATQLVEAMKETPVEAPAPAKAAADKSKQEKGKEGDKQKEEKGEETKGKETKETKGKDAEKVKETGSKDDKKRKGSEDKMKDEKKSKRDTN